jgi:hypothetical protein
MVACGGTTISVTDTDAKDAGTDAAPIPEPILPDASTPPDASGTIPEGAPAFNGGAIAPLGLRDLGTVSAGVAVTFQVPAGTLGFHIMVQSTTPSQELAVMQVKAPSGALLFDNATANGGNHPSSQTLVGTTATAQIPQGAHPNPAVESGAWTVTFAGEGKLTAKIQMQTLPDGAFHGGRLNLNVFIPKGLTLGSNSAITAQSAWSRSEVRDRVEGLFDALYSLYKLRNGRVRFYNTPAQYLTLEEDKLFSVYEQTKVVAADQAVNIMLSELPTQPQWWGISLGIPGAANTPGNEQSWLALASVPDAPAEIESIVLAHEVGHFLGLNHTTEIQGDFADPLPDTPRCAGIDINMLESCPDFENIMFPSGAAAQRNQASAMQRRVLHGSPMVEAFVQGPVVQPFRLSPPRVSRAAGMGALFGHPGTPLTSIEQRVLGFACAHPSHVRAPLSAAERTQMQTIAQSAGVSRLFRALAARAITSP